MRNVNLKSMFTSILTSSNFFKDEPLCVLDVGARGGPQPHWPLYGKNVHVVGFEPYVEESDRLNQIAKSFNVQFTCYPIGPGDQNTTARLYEYPHNKAANSLKPPPNVKDPKFVDITIRRFDDFAKEQNISYVDFVKLDIERHELPALKGMESFLTGEVPILGFEIEVHFQCNGHANAILFSDIEKHLRQFGYCLADIDMFRYAHHTLPSPVAFEHRNHNNEPILGHTLAGKPKVADALFMLDTECLSRWPALTNNPVRLLKLASLYEMYGLPDIAADILLKYSDRLSPVLPEGYSITDCLNHMVPDHFGKGLTYKEYLAIYQESVGRPYLYEEIKKSKRWYNQHPGISWALKVTRFAARHPIYTSRRVLQRLVSLLFKSSTPPVAGTS